MTEHSQTSASLPTRRCHAHWCSGPSLQGHIMCKKHDALLTPELRTALSAALQGACGHVQAAQVLALFKTLPEAERERLREAARSL